MPNESTNIECASCHNRFFIDQTLAIVSRSGENQRYCLTCVRRNTRNCTGCGENRPIDCYEHFPFVCIDCQTSFFRCANCDEVFHEENYGDDGLCVDCDNNNRVIRSYSTRPTFELLGEGDRHFGVELEVESIGDRHEDARKVNELFPVRFAVLKDDGSLGNGFEICTRPATLEKHRETWPSFFSERPRSLQSYNTRSCGLHIHVSKRGVSSLGVAKIVCFVNHTGNVRFIDTMAGRYSNGYSERKRKALSSAHYCTGDKYEMVNLCHDATMEFRIFKGTLKEHSFFKALEFCDALTTFAMDANVSQRNAVKHSAFVLYVAKNAHQWPMLHAFIECRWKGRNPCNGHRHWSLINNENPRAILGSDSLTNDAQENI